MMDWFRKSLGFRTVAESRELARQEAASRQAREIAMQCKHPCAKCEYFSRVYEISSSEKLKADAAELKAEHVEECGQDDLSRHICEVESYPVKRRLRSCVERWPECEEGEYNPYCCRFPKSCSCTVYDPAKVSLEDLEG